MISLDYVYQFCFDEYKYYIESYDKYKNVQKMADWYIAKANAFACVMRYLELLQNKDLFSYPEGDGGTLPPN